MQNPIQRILISAILFSLISGIVVTIIGLILGWKTSAQFSDGFFWAGAIMISLGILNIRGAQTQLPSGLATSQSATHLNSEERFKLWTADTFHGYKFMTSLGISGLLLLGLASLAILVGR
ncbi:MAG TPA: hypothetical protein VLZ89_16425 [Anaerolineales bacterium]|nr:hypothetical protein [Anaerolineales bacterium]